jgi:peptidoglycan/xylan/chitin deacetylase (PgdA/CDA1 family)
MRLIQQPPFMFRWAYPEAVWRLSKTEMSVYLTFDDGPIPEVTPWVLEILNQYGIKATFFCVGENVSKHPEIFRQIIEQGHKVGNHSHHHVRGSSLSLEDYLNDIEEAQKRINSDLFRPPYGSLTIQQYNKLKKLYKIVFWDVLTEDYNKNLSPYDCLQNVQRYSRNGSIIVFHDSLKAKDRLFEFLPSAIQYLKEKGYNFNVIE